MSIPNPPGVVGVTWRPATEADAEALATLFNTVGEVDGTPERMSPETMLHLVLSSPHADLERKTLLGVTADGTVVARAVVRLQPSDAIEQRAYINPGVAPDWRDRGLEEFVTDWSVAVAESLLETTASDLPKYLSRFAYTSEVDEIERIERRGFHKARYFWEMERPLGDEQAGADPDGIAIVLWEESHDEPSRLVSNAAFADHWGSQPISEEDWMHDTIGTPRFRRDLSFCALDDREIVGYSHSQVFPEDWDAAGRTEGWIGDLAVLRDWRKRGIATSLLRRSFVAMEAAGLDYVMIGVDSESPTRAQRLYEAVGFRTKHTSLVLERRVG